MGNQRFKCKQCGLLFTNTSSAQTQANYFIWFKRWVLQKDTFEILVKQSGHSQSKLQRIFRQYLSSPPTFIIHQKLQLYLIIDGTYFTEGLCLILYYDSELRYSLLLYRYSSNEFYKEIKEDLENLKKLGIDIAAVTCDGKKSIIRAVEKTYPAATLQRCMVHVQRMVRLWLTRIPKLQASKELRYLIGLLHHRGVVEQYIWIIAFEAWYKRHQAVIEEKVLHRPTGRWWYKHQPLRRSAVMVKKAFADMFHFIGDNKIPKTTNGLDSYFGHLKLNLNVHRGLSKRNRQSYILWYLHLKGLRL